MVEQPAYPPRCDGAPGWSYDEFPVALALSLSEPEGLTVDNRRYVPGFYH